VGRHVQANFRSRKSLARFLNQLKSVTTRQWPQRLKNAWILLQSEMSLPNSEALSVIFDSVSAAHRYLQAENTQVGQIEEFRARTKIKRFYFRIAKCANRAPAVIRASLDARIFPLVKESVSDLEIIESIFDAIRATFEEFPAFEASRTALKLIEGINRTDFSMLRITFRKESEKSLHELVNTVAMKKGTTTIRLLNILATSIDDTKLSRLSPQSHFLIKNYVAEVAEIWRRAGLKPSRARRFEDCSYTSKFHRFVELLLEGVAESRENLSRARSNGARSSSENDRMYYHWYVSDDHVRAALGA
jgi:hypothetical protein